MSAATSRFSSVGAFRSGAKPTGKSVLEFPNEINTKPSLLAAYVTVGGSKIVFTDTNGTLRTIMCNYGIMRVMQLRRVSSLKQYYPASAVSSITVKRGRYREGTARLGETELLSMMMPTARTEMLSFSASNYTTNCSPAYLLAPNSTLLHLLPPDLSRHR